MTESEKNNNTESMSFLGHLEELRWRLFRSAIAVLIFGIAFFVFREELSDVLYMNMSKTDFITYKWFCKAGHLLGLGDELCVDKIDFNVTNTVFTGQFSSALFFAIVGGIICAFPYIAYQIWGFVKPALKQNEKRASRAFLPSAILLFAMGILFGYFLISPLCVQFFANFKLNDEIANLPTISSYMTIITTTTFFTALLFELPIVAYILSKAGMITPTVMRKYRKHAIVVVLILSAIITPPDLFSQIIVSIPIIVLYEISIIVSGRVEKNAHT